MPKSLEITRSDGTSTRRRARAGDMRWDGTVWTRWNGRRWTKAAYALDPARLLRRPRIFHAGHAIATFITGGLWGFVWIALILGAREVRVRYEVDPWGNVWPWHVRS